MDRGGKEVGSWAVAEGPGRVDKVAAEGSGRLWWKKDQAAQLSVVE